MRYVGIIHWNRVGDHVRHTTQVIAIRRAGEWVIDTAYDGTHYVIRLIPSGPRHWVGEDYRTGTNVDLHSQEDQRTASFEGHWYEGGDDYETEITLTVDQGVPA